MGPGTDQCTSLDNGHLKECVPPLEDDDEDNIDQPNAAAKPPRSLQPVRHCISQAMLAGTSDSVGDFSSKVTRFLFLTFEDYVL
ncbi:hypothetical protein HanPSC8_Chr09g0377171 [Helianthus annuus]|nr:hypothetical protein HanPSC8_Chr09g0377171 [Helianthus annuus]